MPIDSVEAIDFDGSHLLILPPTGVVPQPILSIFGGGIAEQGLILS